MKQLNDDFKNVSIKIIRDPEMYKYHTIWTADVFKHGMDKAVILGNIDRVQEIYQAGELHLGFAYIKEKKFYRLLKELVKDGFLVLNPTNKKELE